MRTSRPIAWLTLLGAMVFAVPNAGAQQRDPYPATLQFGTGLINIPVAWVSASSADAWLQMSAKSLRSFPSQTQSLPSLINTNVSIDTHWLGRFSVGVSAYSQNPEYGFFGQALLLREKPASWMPSVAIGARNIGPERHEDRLLIAHDIQLDPKDSAYKHTFDQRYRKFSTAPSVYGVVTKEFSLSSMMSRMPATMMSVTVGAGSGLFQQDGGLGKEYNAKGGLHPIFLGTRFTLHPTLNTTVHLMVEDDAWDVNAGVVTDWRGISLGIYGTELEEGGHKIGVGFDDYNYTKINLSLGYSGNIIDISRGVILRTRITGLMREQDRLRREIAIRERHIHGLEVSLQKAQQGELSGIEDRRKALEGQVNEEREAIRRAEERLRQTQNPPPATPPPATPPPSAQPRVTPTTTGTTTPTAF